jgi:hypothetical protein
MRRTLLLGGVAAVAGGLLSGCGGGSSTTVTKVAVGYVWVAAPNQPPGTPDVILTASSTAPNGYAKPATGTLVMTVPNGEITRASDSESFNLGTSNEVVATVKSTANGTPTLQFSATGLTVAQVSGGNLTRSNIPTQTVSLTGANGTVQNLSYQTPAYTPGAPASMKVLVRDPSTLGAGQNNRFGAINDTMPSLVPTAVNADRYEVVVLLLDANNVVIPGTTFNVTDPDSNTTENSVSYGSSLLTVAGGGVEGTIVPLTFTSPQATNLTTVINVPYSYGAPVNFRTTAAPSGSTNIVWPASGVAATQNIVFTLTNGRNVPVPNRNVTMQRRNTAGVVENVYPGPASGNALSATSGTTDANGEIPVTFSTPAGAAANASFNNLNIKYTGTQPGNLVDVLVGSQNTGSKTMVITRPLGSLSTTGPARMDINQTSVSSTLNGGNPFRVTGAADIDTQSVVAPAVTWTIVNTPSTVNVGDLDDASARSVSVSSIAGSTTNQVVQVAAGNNAGEFTVTATSGTVTSNVVTQVFGVPSKIRLTPSPLVTGYAGTAGAPIGTTVSFIDAYGHVIPLNELTITSKAGTILSGGAGNITTPALPSLGFNITPSSSGAMTARMTLAGSWAGAAGAPAGGNGSGTWNITREVDVVTP